LDTISLNTKQNQVNSNTDLL